jgi:hypothetical protein
MLDLRKRLDRVLEMDDKHQLKYVLFLGVDNNNGLRLWVAPPMSHEHINWLIDQFKVAILGPMIKDQATREEPGL